MGCASVCPQPLDPYPPPGCSFGSATDTAATKQACELTRRICDASSDIETLVMTGYIDCDIILLRFPPLVSANTAAIAVTLVCLDPLLFFLLFMLRRSI